MNLYKLIKEVMQKGKTSLPLSFSLIVMLSILIFPPSVYASKLQVLVAKNALERGHVMTPDDVVLKQINVTGNRDFLTHPSQVKGTKLKRRLRADQPINRAYLDSPILVERGQHVLMIALQNGIEARTLGEAMKKGRKGETIKVKNESSQRLVSAIVTDIGVVHMLNPLGQ